MQTQNKSNTTPGVGDLMAMTYAEFKKLTPEQIRGFCKKIEGLSAGGTEKERFDSIYAKRFGFTTAYVGEHTRCNICHAELKVKRTFKQTYEKDSDGKLCMVENNQRYTKPTPRSGLKKEKPKIFGPATYTVKCKGRHQHTYELRSAFDFTTDTTEYPTEIVKYAVCSV